MTCRFDVKKVKSCIMCDYSESNVDSGEFKCNKFNLDLTVNMNDSGFSNDCKLPTYFDIMWKIAHLFWNED